MNTNQAKTEARKRWGKNAHIKRDGHRCSVGRIIMGAMFSVEGQGKSWAAAFRDFDTKHEKNRLFEEAKGQPCPYCSRTMRSDVLTEEKAKREVGPRRWNKLSDEEKKRARYPMWPRVIDHGDHFEVMCSDCAKADVEKAS